MTYSEELVELVARGIVDEIKKYPRLPQHEFGGAISWGANERDLARAILDALSSSGRLVPEGSEVREEWGVIVHARYGDLWIGRGDRQSAEREAESASGRYTFPREVGVRKVIWTPPTPWTPAEPAQETP